MTGMLEVDGVKPESGTRSGVRFLGNTEALNDEFKSMALGLGLDVRTYELPHPSPAVGEGNLGQAQPDGMAFQNHQDVAPTQKQREEFQK